MTTDVAASVDGVAEDRASAQPRRVISVLEGGMGALAGLVGAVIIAVASVIDRTLVVPELYESTSDLLVHLAAEVTATMSLWLLLRAGLEVGFRLNQAFSGNERSRRRAHTIAVLFSGGVTALGLYEFVISPSSRVHMLPVAGWMALLLVAGCGASFGCYSVMRARLPLRLLTYGVASLVVALSIHLWAVHRYLRHYGNLHSLIIVAAVALAALGAGFALNRVGLRTRFRVGVGSVALLVVSVLALLVVSPSYSSRRAVLVWGGVAKRMLVAVAWPLLDRDGDGAPAVLWGADPDDRDARLTALSPHDSAAKPSQSLAIPKQSTRRNLLWIVVDTVRADSFDRILSERRGSVLSEFAYFVEYRSCSSRTHQVMAQLLGSDHCDQRTLSTIPGESLLEALEGQGYQSHLVGYFALEQPFTSVDTITDDAAILASALDLLSTASSVPRALFVHFKGGHAPYQSSGSSERERYEAALRSSFDAVERLVAAVPADWAVVVMGDHGEEFGEHGSLAHATTLYEEVLRTPLLMRAPEFEPGRHSGTFSCPDLRWKALVAAGLLKEAPEPLEFLYAAVDVRRGEFGYLRDEQVRSLALAGTKAIWSPGLGIWELYDLNTDPSEQLSLAQRKPELLRSMQARLTQMAGQCGPVAKDSAR